MANHLPSDENESDERLLTVLLHYIQERNMPIATAREILRHNLLVGSRFDVMWSRLNNMLNKKLSKAG
jgi:hypothetical protein